MNSPESTTDPIAAVLAKVTAAAAAGAIPHVGTGEKEVADQAAVDAIAKAPHGFAHRRHHRHRGRREGRSADVGCR